MNFYRNLSAIGFLRKSYALKFLFIAFLGIHIPLIGIVMYVGFWTSAVIAPITLVVLTLVFTLAATAATLFILNKLLNPVRLAERSLQTYVKNGTIPDLPEEFTDEVGSLLQAIQYTVESLEAANKTKLEMMYTITHDLRSPLAQIVMLSDLVKNGGVEQDKFVEMVKSGAQNELSFIDNYITSLKTSDNFQKLTLDTRVSLSELVNKSVRFMEAQLQHKKLKLEINVTSEAYVVTTREYLFEHVIRNLISNAIKFSYADRLIEITAYVSNGQTIFGVKDEGMGFDEALAGELFTKFTSHRRKGTLGEDTNGIGLYLTREIVKQHNGSITAKSEGIDRGATFTVILTHNP